ncbi:unnamed protein product [Periconia digitata]|uniref:Uncharacterized protein n=1 Tax=Periconia digitata TaxID=1303443 RepID=A0A9W4U3L0_9PLEO|nr:unnamed protein product [Periconia digitata]
MTTSSTTAYTHLESLLLFQSLRDHGLDPQVFSSISELLKTNPHITQNPTFQSGRLSPDALRNCYLHILKEEIKTEQPLPADESPNLSGKSSRKRKAPSPALSTFQESIQYQHLIPKLVGKLYARYRSAIVEEIKRDEDDYEKLQLEVQGIQRGLYDEQLTKTANVNSKPKSTSHSPDIAKNQQLPSQQDKAPQRASLPSPVSVSAPVAPPPIHVQTDGPSQQQQPPSKPSTLLPAPSGPSQPDQNSKAAQTKPRASTWQAPDIHSTTTS